MKDKKISRRDFLLYAIGGWAAVGAGATLYAMYKTWEPLPEVKAAGIVEFDLSTLKEGEIRVVEWRRKPVFILRRKKNIQVNCPKRTIRTDIGDFTVVIGICTHLGCIPNWEPENNVWHCPCHGGKYNACGENIFGPPPRPLDIPPFKLEGTKIVLGEEGPEYKALIST